MMNFNAVKDDLIAEAERQGLTEYEIYFMESASLSTETLKNEISSFSSGVSGGVCFRCIVNGKMGNASTELLTKEEMKALVLRAMNHAKYTESDDKAILFAGSPEYQTISRTPDQTIDTALLKEVALDLQKNIYQSSSYITDGTQSAAFGDDIHMELLNSHGLHLTNHGSVCGAYIQAVVQKDGESQDGFEWTLGLQSEELQKLPVKARDKALSKVGAREIPSGKYDVIISGKKMRDLLSAFSSVFSAKNAQLGMSLLKEREGEQIAAEKITVIDDPMMPGSPMQTAFDGEGVATYSKNVIENGVLKTLLYDLATADRAGKVTTGNGQRVHYSDSVGIRPYHFYIAPGKVRVNDLQKQLGDGLYITEFKGLHAGCNAVTGDFSIESAGYRVQNGVLCEAVKSFTIAGNFFTLLQEIEEIADRTEFGIPNGFTCYGAPDTLIRGISIAGK